MGRDIYFPIDGYEKPALARLARHRFHYDSDYLISPGLGV
jgi:hypothetical protein